jgi:CHAT domain-containing protein
MGLTRAFFYAGAHSLVASLWNVNDAATADLVKRFYVNLKAGMARDEALRRAELILMKAPGSPWRHSYLRPPFVFVGDSEQAQSASNVGPPTLAACQLSSWLSSRVATKLAVQAKRSPHEAGSPPRMAALRHPA